MEITRHWRQKKPGSLWSEPDMQFEKIGYTFVAETPEDLELCKSIEDSIPQDSTIQVVYDRNVKNYRHVIWFPSADSGSLALFKMFWGEYIVPTRPNAPMGGLMFDELYD